MDWTGYWNGGGQDQFGVDGGGLQQTVESDKTQVQREASGMDRLCR